MFTILKIFRFFTAWLLVQILLSQPPVTSCVILSRKIIKSKKFLLWCECNWSCASASACMVKGAFGNDTDTRKGHFTLNEKGTLWVISAGWGG